MTLIDKRRALMMNPFRASHYSILLTKTEQQSLGGVWTSPVTRQITVNLIGGGNGGDSGYSGSKSEPTDGRAENISTEGTPGGLGGTGGNGGRVYTFTMNVVKGQQYSFSCGSGSSGGAMSYTQKSNNPAPTSESSHQTGSGATTFAGYSSASGQTLQNGITDIYTGITYALPGETGTAGGKGGDGGTNAESGEDGQDVIFNGVTYTGGSGSTFTVAINAYLGGNGGGGAAVGNNGFSSGPATWSYDQTVETITNKHYNSRPVDITLQDDGGVGASPISRSDSTIIGCGGAGGHGGGGNGGRSGYPPDGTLLEELEEYKWYLYTWRADTMILYFGRGGAGGAGADGGILIYI